MHARMDELGRKLILFVVVAVGMGIAGVALSIPSASDGEWTGMASLVLGLLGITAGAMVWTGAGAGTVLDGMNVGVLWATLHLPYIEIFRAGGQDMQYPIPAIGAILSFGSSQSVNGQLAQRDVWGIALLGIVLLALAMTARKDWTRLMMRREIRTGMQTA